MLSDYAPILLFLGICVAFAVVVQFLVSQVGPRRPSPEKELPYESGIVPRVGARRRCEASRELIAMEADEEKRALQEAGVPLTARAGA